MLIKLGRPTQHDQHHVWKLGVYVAGDDGEFSDVPDFFEILSGVEGPELLQSAHLDLNASALLSLSHLLDGLAATAKYEEGLLIDDEEDDGEEWQIEFEIEPPEDDCS